MQRAGPTNLGSYINLPAPRQAGGERPARASLDGVVELGPRMRVAFAAAWIAVQVGLVVSAGGRADGLFGFRMFPEASTLQIQLARVTKSGERPAAGGEWSARDLSGQLRHFAWRDRVRDPVLSSLDVRVFASSGAATQLARLQRALDDVADHIPEDEETLRLVAHVTVWQNGRDPVTTTLESPLRGRAP